MLLLEEQRALEPDPRRTVRRWSLLSVVTVLLVAIPVWIWAGQQGPREHLLGLSKVQTVEVVSVERIRACANGGQHRWGVEAVPVQAQPTEVIAWERCAPMGVLDEGDVMDVWVTDSGFVAEYSATTNRVLFVGSIAGIVVAILGLGALGARREKRLRHLLRGAGDGDLGDPISVVVEQDEKKRRWTIRASRKGSELAAYDESFQPVLSTGPDSGAVLAGAPQTGRWQLRLSPHDHEGHRIGLMTRDDKRCWIQLKAKSQKVAAGRR